MISRWWLDPDPLILKVRDVTNKFQVDNNFMPTENSFVYREVDIFFGLHLSEPRNIEIYFVYLISVHKLLSWTSTGDVAALWRSECFAVLHMDK